MFKSCVPTVSSTARLWRWCTSTPTTPTVTSVTRTKTEASRTARRCQGRNAGGVGVGGGLTSITRSALRLRLEPECLVQRPGAAAAGQQEEEDGGPGQMLGVGIRVDEGLDHHDHAEQRQRRQPGA